ncbi:DUF6950 family protein [Vibrio quintilis]|uniref:DUF6950 domain-containing protein n=1 Tax=Vibrio quintilis TaxID=1117707 RepID=A0A1M7Z1U1_9VIBR|nr:hypothetical protein [Vibrio quintilis]SHO58804.1 hypothetical protein VQ7734_04576 [Vibrio quintilis]
MIDLFHDFLDPYLDRPFQTGVNDCALFVADWVKQLTGDDFAAPFRGHYQTDLGSARLIKKQGYRDLADLVISTLDSHCQRREFPALAQRGDVAWLDNQGRMLCGIVAACGVIAIGTDGLISLPISAVKIAWQVREVH